MCGFSVQDLPRNTELLVGPADERQKSFQGSSWYLGLEVSSNVINEGFRVEH